MTAEFDVCREELISLARRLVSESGNFAEFDASSWIDNWLNEPLPALGSSPSEYIRAGHSCKTLKDLLRRMQSGSFS